MKNPSNLKTVALATAAFALVTVSILALVTDSSRGQAPPSYRQQQTPPQASTFDVVEARKFVLKDDRGRVRAELTPDEKSTAIGLRLYDRRGRIKVSVTATDDAAAVSLVDSAGEDRISLVLGRDGASIVVSGSDSEAGLSAEDGGPTAFAVGKGGKDVFVLGVDAYGAPVAKP
jgi:hypothetical protein